MATARKIRDLIVQTTTGTLRAEISEDRFRAYDLRHTFASLALEGGDSRS
jgi:integrase